MIENIFDTNWVEVLDVFIRAMVSLVTLFLVTKMLGKKQVSQLSVFDYVIGISIGNFAAEMTFNLDSQYMNGITAVVIFGVVAYIVSILTLKSIFLRRFFMGTPSILIQDGKLMFNNLRKSKMDINDLLEECRANGYFDVSEIEYALLEVNGKLSILPKGKYKPVVVSDLNITEKRQGLCANVIIDGNYMVENIKTIGKTVTDVADELKSKGYQSINDLLLVTIDVNNKMQIYTKETTIKPKNVLE